MKGKTDLALCLLMFSFCGLLGNKGVPKAQVNNDIGGQTITVKDPNGIDQQWSFKDDTYRCFAPGDTPAEITETEDVFPIKISSIRIASGEETPVLFGEVVLHYKKNDDKWVLDKIEPKDVRTNALTGDAFSKYLDLQMPLCNYFKHRS